MRKALQGMLRTHDQYCVYKFAVMPRQKNGYSGDCSLADRMDRVYEKDFYAFLMMPNSNEITATTMSICINPPALHAKTPNNHPMIQITAIR